VALLRDPVVKPSVVGFAICIKGLFAAYDFQAAETLLVQMSEAGLKPNLRTANTFLRGCLTMGAVEAGMKCYKLAQGDWGLVPDASMHGVRVFGAHVLCAPFV
jgi:pentatricopeptide repeat protein